MKKKQTSIRAKIYDTVSIAIFVAIICVCSWTTIPLPGVPITLQVFGISSALFTLGGRRGSIAVIVYILTGALGLPVFSGFGSGPAVLFGLTGGYILGFLPMALAYAFAETLFKSAAGIFKGLLILPGLALCYGIGTAWFCIAYAKTGGTVSVAYALMTCVVPFIIPDLIKIALALKCSSIIRRFNGSFAPN